MAAILADDIFKGIFLNENDRILIQISLMFVPRGPVDNKWATGSGNGLLPVWPVPEPMLTQWTDASMRHQGEMS